MTYNQNLRPVERSNNAKVRFRVKAGQTTAQIGEALQKVGLIRDAKTFQAYVKLSRSKSSLQPGTYALSKSLSIQKIVDHIESGKTDLLLVTILPGATLEDIRAQLRKKGYSASEITTALNATYTSSLLKDKPSSADLEGYIFPETYQVASDETLQSLFERDFDTLFNRLKKDGLNAAFKAHGLTIHQALTLASIVQNEASQPEDQRQVAQVFYKRLKADMKLESDVTFNFGAKKLDVTPSVDLDSPYNTRLKKGLPPGPISNMNYSALRAVAQPAKDDFLYFVAGDDGTVHFSHTLKEHKANIEQYCHRLCQ